MTFTLKPLASAIGAEVVGLDLRTAIDDDTIAALRDAWHRHTILLFRGQSLDHAQHVAFSRRFGALDDHASIPRFRHPEHPEILLVTNHEAGGKRLAVGRQWHSDLSTTTRPAKGSLLYCSVLPPVGGDTMFCNMTRAWETLSPGLQSMLDGRWALHDMTIARETQTNRTAEDLADIRRRNPPVFQPVARVHDEAGHKALYVSEMTTVSFENMTRAESQPLLEYLYQHSVQPENVYRHRWQVGDLMMWDNRSAMHIALSDYDQTQPRMMYRTTLLGNPSGRVAEEAALALAA
ncbi:TauD/TfdA family dioxygenase [Caballeronia sp. LZ035]|uniref:TauD/TfdA dioxygenase family protein n=1 Tax=Caballeronia sp. LZ035 TaxID=3038568 RepID=UPI00285BF7D0|nr:TauD/TfdA family dioxygenase [Caballeronia sp. LZ035]MDR5759352.1 TauD/TfdA family dioxygenase [Caballeronia sp. LZ035]